MTDPGKTTPQVPQTPAALPGALSDQALDAVAGGAGEYPEHLPYTVDNSCDPNSPPTANMYGYGTAGHRFNLGQ